MADYNPALPPERIAYFWSNVDRSAGSDACWPWMRARLPRGYGVLGCGPNRHYSHRLAFALSVGPVPSGMYVCHRCDNPPCCNPAHMFVGTALENSRDAVAKGRHSGLDTERARGIKLTADDVVRARSDYRSGVPMAELARRYGVRTHNMYKAVRGITWRHVPDPVESPAGAILRRRGP